MTNSELKGRRSGAITSMLVFFSLLLCSVLTVNAQSLKAGPRGAAVQSDVSPSSPQGVTITPAMKPEDQLRIRNLQYQKDKKLLELQNTVARYKELQAALQADDQIIEAAVIAAAKAAGVDTTRYIFDLDSLTWNARPAASTQTETAPKTNGGKTQ